MPHESPSALALSWASGPPGGRQVSRRWRAPGVVTWPGGPRACGGLLPSESGSHMAGGGDTPYHTLPSQVPGLNSRSKGRSEWRLQTGTGLQRGCHLEGKLETQAVVMPEVRFVYHGVGRFVPRGWPFYFMGLAILFTYLFDDQLILRN